VLFAPVSLPLSSAIEMAGALMGQAKVEGRRRAAEGEPSPACVDWQAVTGGVVESPQTMRQRDWFFFDRDIEESVQLTRRPYQVQDLEKLRELADEYQKLPAAIVHQAQESLRAGYWDRKIWTARLGKHRGSLATHLAESEGGRDLPGNSRWERHQTEDGWVRSTDVLDVMELIVEEIRMSRQTVSG
jgi:hypothetical protein